MRSEARRLVRFAPYNMLRPGEPGIDACCASLFPPEEPRIAASSPVQPFDVIFCRNVLLYFSFSAAQVVVDRLIECLSPTGFLFVAPAEAHSKLFRSLELHFDGEATYFTRRSSAAAKPVPPRVPAPAVVAPPGLARAPLTPSVGCPGCSSSETASRGRARQLLLSVARQAKALEEIETWCLRAAVADPSAPAPLQVLAAALLGARRFEKAEQVLSRSLERFPEQGFTRYLLADLYRRTSRPGAALVAAKQAKALLGALDPALSLAVAEGATAGQLCSLSEAMVKQLS